MDYQVLELVCPYLDKGEAIFHSLVNKDWLLVIKEQPFKTPYRVIVTPSLLSYSYAILNLVYNETVASEIIKVGNLETIKILHNNHNLCDSKYMNRASRSGHLDVMKWLKANGCEFSWDTFDYASTNGSLVNMEWLKENGCEFDYYTFTYAAKNGNSETMKWLKGNGCPQ